VPGVVSGEPGLSLRWPGSGGLCPKAYGAGGEAWVVWFGAKSVRFGEAVMAEPALEYVGSAQGSAFEPGRITRRGAGYRFNCRDLRRWRMIVPAPQRQSRDVTAGEAVASQERADRLIYG
jgi:hypothetical protein